MKEWEKETPEIELYSDGGAKPNPGKGGYGIILIWNGKKKEFHQGFAYTTSNRMELLGVISGLEKLKPISNVKVYTDSQYVVNGMNQEWAKRWKAKNWYKSDGERALNTDLWGRLLNLAEKHNVEFYWVKGHNGHPLNERCDYLATDAINSNNLIIDEEYVKSQDESDSQSTLF